MVDQPEKVRRLEAIVRSILDGYPLKWPAVSEAAKRIGLRHETLRTMLRREPELWQAIHLTVAEEKRKRMAAGANAPEMLKDESDVSQREREAWERERLGLKDEIKELKEKLNQARRAELDSERVRREIFGLTSNLPEPPDWLVENAPGGSVPGVPLMFWSDWHYGEVVSSEETAGLNTFDAEIAQQRVRRLVERTIDLCMEHMVRPNYPGAVVALGGDMITGTIHDELAETNDRHTSQALLDLQDILAWALEQIADEFGRVFVPCVVGNHGRMTQRPRAKGRVHTSFEWLLYCSLERYFLRRGDDRVKFLIPGETDAHFRVYDHRFCLTHGDSLGVRGGDGIIGALGPITRGRIKLRNAETQIGRDFDTLLIGHWHQYLPLPGCVVNGSLKGVDEFSRLYLRAPYQIPTQALFFVNPKWGITAHWPVFLDSPKSGQADDREWVSWAA